MQPQSPWLQFSRVTAALILLLFGLIGLLGSRRGSGFDQTIQAEASESLDSQLLEREVMLDRRREAETLLMAFTRAQMTRHYWGEFAASLQELGLPVGHQLETTVERSGGATRLWIMPRNGTEAYLAEVERWNGRLRTRQCRGERVAAEGDFKGSCPPGWSEIDLET